MYLDNRSSSTRRESFTYKYKGSEMLAAVNRRLAQMIRRERKAREEIIALTRDSSVGPNDGKMKDAKSEVLAAAAIVEELMVYASEFKRLPDQEFTLGSGDIVFLGLIDTEISDEVENGIAPSN